MRSTMSTALPCCAPSGPLASRSAPLPGLWKTSRVFGRDHEEEDVAARIDHLMAAVFVADEHDRMEALRRHVAPDFVYVSPEAVYEGPQGLSDAFSRYRTEAWWQTGLRRTSPIDLHHGSFRFTWERIERGATVMAGWGFGSLDETGAICRVVTFEGLVPGQPEGRS
jgi:hypothetical protein